MDLSDAILKGCQFRDQGRGGFFVLGKQEAHLADFIVSCAIGAALEGLWGPQSIEMNISTRTLRITHTIQATSLEDEAKRLFPVLNELMLWPELWKDEDSLSGPYAHLIAQIIFRLNDHKEWTREQIAAWVKYVVEGAPMIPEDV